MKKNILITGASGNLGKAAVEKFVAEGHFVIATVSPGKTLGFKTGKNVVTYEADLSNESSVQDVIEHIIADHEKIDAAILTVGGFAAGKINSTDGTMIQKMMTLNFNTAYFVSRPVFNHMIEQGRGRIIFIGSRPALVAKDGKNTLAYALSKSMVFKLAELLNAEAAGKNVVSSVIVPSTIDTPQNREAMASSDFSTWVKPEEIAEAMNFLISEKGKALRNPIFKMYSNS
jgi:NAD(P)-dependent dehydrogenase (short-subunit alcohol dehydrogenase family)